MFLFTALVKGAASKKIRSLTAPDFDTGRFHDLDNILMAKIRRLPEVHKTSPPSALGIADAGPRAQCRKGCSQAAAALLVTPPF